MSKNVVIVESPAKAKTIEKFLGKDYKVLSSQGHVRDIVNTKEFKMGIDFNHNYAPIYAVDVKKKKLIELLNNEVSRADTVWLASDEDREGEAIAWHLTQVLNIENKELHRIVFHEITKSAILNAIASPRDIDYNLVNAQQARRVLDRIVGFELSPVLWRKIASGLSAGRVQSVAVRLVVEREREIESFEYVSSYRVVAELISDKDEAVTVRAELNRHFSTQAEALDFLEKCKGAIFEVEGVQSKPLQSSPAPPFTTSTLQQEAARKLKFPVAKTMRIAQSLYEAGHITYMRTDSVNLSSLALNTIKGVIVNDKNFGEKYYQFRQYHTTSKGAQEAHEAIRPTYVNAAIAGQTKDEQRLYDLIRKRTLASQMAIAQFEQTKVQIGFGQDGLSFIATGKTVVFDGFTKVYVQSSDEEEEKEGHLPPLKKGDRLTYNQIKAQESFTKPVPRYSEASLVKKMEELGIGRPSTYATIIATIQDRDYVAVGKFTGAKRNYETLILKKGKISSKTETETYGANTGRLVPTDLGKTTNDFLVEHFPDIINYTFTAKEEENFDLIADGKEDWVESIDRFYKVFHPLLEKIPTGKVEMKRLLGVEPKTQEPIYARLTKLGPCIQIGEVGDEAKKPKFISLTDGQSIYSITFEEALKLMEQPTTQHRTLGQLDGEDLITGIGRFGAYVRRGNTFVSIPKDMTIETITYEQACDLFKKKEAQNVPIHDFGAIKVLNGRYGPYIKADDANYKIPKGTVAETLTEQACRDIIASSSPTGKARKGAKKSTK